MSSTILDKLNNALEKREWGIREFSVLIIAIAIQLWDINVRLSGAYFPKYIPHLIILYTALAVIATVLLDKEPPFAGLFDLTKINFPFLRRLICFMLFSAIAYIIPWINYVFIKIPEFEGIPIRTITGVILLFWPIWIIYLAFDNPKTLTKWVGNIYLLIWVVILIVSSAPIASYQLQNSEIPGVLPGKTIATVYQNFIVGTQHIKKDVTQTATNLPTIGIRNIQAEIEYAKTGIDPRQAKVDTANSKDLGVTVMAMTASSPIYYENDQITVYAQIKAETIDQPVTTKVTCTASSDPVSGTIFPAPEFKVDTYDVYDIDCVFKKGELTEGVHTIKLNTEFNFETVSYLETFFMTEETLREIQKKKQDPLAGYPKPAATSSKGPVNINIKTPDAPIPTSADKKMTVSVTMHNSGQGKIKQLNSMYIFIPKGLDISAIDGREVYIKKECEELPAEETKVCDPETVTVYQVSPDELKKDLYKNIAASREFRLYLEVKDYDKVLGESIIKPGNFYASAKYDYEMQQAIQIRVQKENKAI